MSNERLNGDMSPGEGIVNVDIPSRPRAINELARQHAVNFAEICTSDGEIDGDNLYKAWREYANWKRNKGDFFATDDKKRVRRMVPQAVWSVIVTLQGEQMRNATPERIWMGHETFKGDVERSLDGWDDLFEGVDLGNRTVRDRVDKFCQAMDEVGWTPGDLAARYPTTAIAPYTQVASEYSDRRESTESPVIRSSQPGSKAKRNYLASEY